MDWYYADQGQQKGPVQEEALDDLVRAGVVREETMVWHRGMTNWQPHAAVRAVQPSRIATADAAETRYCGECGRPFPASELVAIGPVSVCASCKPVYLQRMREGGATAVGTLRYAGFWIRVAARLIDAILLNVVLLVIRIPFGIAMFSPTLTSNPAAQMAAVGAFVGVMLLSVVLAASYEIVLVGIKGATIGKMMLGLKVVRANGSKVSFGLSTGRYFAQFVNSITLCIGYIMAGFDDQKRTLADRICETRVVHSRS